MILLIQKDQNTLRILRQLVAQCYPGRKIVAFTKAEAALQYIDSCAEQIGLCFTGVWLDGSSGIRIARHLRRCGHRAKVVFISDTNEYAMEAWKNGVSDYLLEPVTLESVRHTLLTCG